MPDPLSLQARATRIVSRLHALQQFIDWASARTDNEPPNAAFWAGLSTMLGDIAGGRRDVAPGAVPAVRVAGANDAFRHDLSERDDVADQQKKLDRERKDIDTRLKRLREAIETGGDAASLVARIHRSRSATARHRRRGGRPATRASPSARNHREPTGGLATAAAPIDNSRANGASTDPARAAHVHACRQRDQRRGRRLRVRRANAFRQAVHGNRVAASEVAGSQQSRGDRGHRT